MNALRALTAASARSVRDRASAAVATSWRAFDHEADQGCAHRDTFDYAQQRCMHLPASSSAPPDGGAGWKAHLDQGMVLNPCGSPEHPAVREGLIEAGPELISLQEAYTPTSQCFGCGPACAQHGMHLQTFRHEDGVIAELSIPERFVSFPGVVSGGAISTLLDCQGNWAAAVKLMDDSCLPRPPLTVTYNMNVTYRDVTPPDTPVVLRAKATSVTKSERTGRPTVTVDLDLLEKCSDGDERVLVTATGVFKRLGALRVI